MDQRVEHRSPRPTTPADLHRLAEQGRRNGVRILTECVSGARYATSATQPGVIYFVTGYSCTCPGFVGHRRCQHHSLLLAELGWLPDVAGDDPAPEPDPPTPAPPAPLPPGRVVCPGCGRVGVVLQNKPIPPGWLCGRCRPPAPRPVPVWSGPIDFDAAPLVA